MITKQNLIASIEKVLMVEKVSNLDEQYILRTIEDTKEGNEEFQFDVEVVNVSWNQKGEFTVENISELDKDEIMKLHAIKQFIKFTDGKDVPCSKIDPTKYYWYDEMTEEEIIQAFYENYIDDDMDENEKLEQLGEANYFVEQYIKETDYGFVEKVQH